MSDPLPWRDVLVKELKSGGKLPPCPCCGTGRVQRSVYVRCVRCGINWEEGEALDRDPRTERTRKLVEDTRASAKAKKEDSDGRR